MGYVSFAHKRNAVKQCTKLKPCFFAYQNNVFPLDILGDRNSLSAPIVRSIKKKRAQLEVCSLSVVVYLCSSFIVYGSKNPKNLPNYLREGIDASSFSSLLLGRGFTIFLKCRRFPLLCGCILRIDLERLVEALKRLLVAV